MSFLSFTGENEKNEDDSYDFVMEGKKGGKLIKTYNIVVKIASPIVDNNFKQVFGKKEKITRSLLNSLLYPVTNDIIEVEFLPLELPGKISEYPKKVKLYGLDSLRVDVLCKCKLKNEKVEKKNKEDEKEQKIEEENIFELQFDSDEIINEIDGIDEYVNELQDIIDLEKDEINDDEEEKGGKNRKNKKKKKPKDEIIDEDENTIIIDLEMQNGYDLDKSRKLIDYAKALNEKYGKKIIVLSLAFKGFPNPKKNKGFEISLAKTNLSDYKIIKKFDDYVIYQIDLDYCRTLIQKKKSKLWILNEKQVMNLSSKEWIKYLTLPIWCKSTEPYYYEFPPLEKDFFLTEYVYEAFVILSNQEESTYLNYAKKQEDQEKQ